MLPVWDIACREEVLLAQPINTSEILHAHIASNLTWSWYLKHEGDILHWFENAINTLMRNDVLDEVYLDQLQVLLTYYWVTKLKDSIAWDGRIGDATLEDGTFIKFHKGVWRLLFGLSLKPRLPLWHLDLVMIIALICVAPMPQLLDGTPNQHGEASTDMISSILRLIVKLDDLILIQTLWR